MKGFSLTGLAAPLAEELNKAIDRLGGFLLL
jgi:hypothetical protein